MADSPLPSSQSDSQLESETQAVPPQNATKPVEASSLDSSFPWSRLSRGFRSRGWQWLGLSLTVPFLTLNALVAWQAHSLTQYRPGRPSSKSILNQTPLQRLGSFATGIKIPRPENQYNPADVGLPFDTHTIELSNGEQLEAWLVRAPEPQPTASSATEPEPQPRAEPGAESNTVEQNDTAQSNTAVSPSVISQPPARVKKAGMVLLFPAYGASKQTLLQEAKLLSSLGYDSLMVDFRGTGGSSGSDTTLGQREAADVAATVDYVAKTFGEPAIALYGRLMSAGTVLRAVAEYNLEPEALLLEDPYAYLYSVTEATVEAVGLPRSPTTQMLMLWGSVLQGSQAEALDPITYSSKVTQPTLMLYGTEQSWTTLDEVMALRIQLGGPKAVVGLRSQKAVPLSVTAPAPWMDRVEGFLDRNLGN